MDRPDGKLDSPEKMDNPDSPEGSGGSGGGGWGGWGFFSDLQKAAAIAAEEISRNAAAVANAAAKGISDLQLEDSETESNEGDGVSQENPKAEGEVQKEDEDEKMRKSALEKLEAASEDSLLGQGLKALDSSVENFASGAWTALGNAWRGGTELVQKLEHSATSLAESIQHGNVPATTSIIESGKLLTAKGIEVLERVGKETVELIEGGLDTNKNHGDMGGLDDEQFEEVTFERCFYIYGGPDHLEELEALSNHYALLFNRRKVKLASDQKSYYDGKLKEVQLIFNLKSELEEDTIEADKGKEIEATEIQDIDELKPLRDASISRAADMASGFATALGGLGAAEIVQRTEKRLEGIHSEGIHRLSELCCFAVSHLVILGKSIISNRTQESRDADDSTKNVLPEDPVSKAKLIRSKTKSMAGDIGAVSNSFVTGMSDIIEAYTAAIKKASANAPDKPSQKPSVQEKACAMIDLLRAGQSSALEKIQDALQYLGYVVLYTSMAST